MFWAQACAQYYRDSATPEENIAAFKQPRQASCVTSGRFFDSMTVRILLGNQSDSILRVKILLRERLKYCV